MNQAKTTRDQVKVAKQKGLTRSDDKAITHLSSHKTPRSVRTRERTKKDSAGEGFAE